MARHLVTMSGDGTRLAYVANQRIYVRSLSDLVPREICCPIPEGVVDAALSPDGRSVAFHSSADNTIKRFDIGAGVSITLCRSVDPGAISWGADGIVFAQMSAHTIMRVSPSGGEPEVLTKTDGVPYGPQMLPDRETLLFTLAPAAGQWDKAQIVAQSLRSGVRKVLIPIGRDARYIPSGHLVYAVKGVLFGVVFDARRVEVRGDPVPVVEGVSRSTGTTGAAHYAVSNSGTLAYVTGPASGGVGERDLAMVDRKGNTTALKLPPAAYEHVRLSPDGKWIAVGRDDAQGTNVWIYEVGGGTALRQLTFGGKNRFPVWTRDSRRVAFQSDRDGDLGVFWQRADGSDKAERLTRPQNGDAHIPESWAPTGDLLLVNVAAGTFNTLSVFSITKRTLAPFGIVKNVAAPNAEFSPDGRFVAYGSSESGHTAVYVQPFPPTGAKYSIDTGGITPVWSRDGRELFTQLRGGVAIVGVSTSPRFAVGKFLQTPRQFRGGNPDVEREWDISTDGQFFLAIINAQDSVAAGSAPQIQLVVNWFEELRHLVPVK
jgi:serine/threonine-protein kinase